MKPIRSTLFSMTLVSSMALAPQMAMAQNQETEPGTLEQLRTELSEAMEAVGAYSVEQRDEALAAARDALDRVDAEIERQEQALRENWAEMSEAAQDAARERLNDLRDARNRLAERFGALQAGADSAWDELTDGFGNAWDSFTDVWSQSDEDGEPSGQETRQDTGQDSGQDAESGQDSGNAEGSESTD